VDRVLQILENNQLYVKRSKCTFGKQEVEYLGHIVSCEGVKVDLQNIQAIKKWSIPKKIKSIRGFFGLKGYYHKSFKNYACIVGPLTSLLKKNSSLCNEEATLAFSLLKKAMYLTPILVKP
jgi:hypothetical protein